MIMNDFLQYPEFREGFFKLVQNIIVNCTQGMLELEGSYFSTIIHTVIFAMKHEKPELMEIGLNSMYELNDKICSVVQVSNIFYKSFYTLITREVLTVLTDCRHLSGFKLQCKIMQ